MAAPFRHHQVMSDQRWGSVFGRQERIQDVLGYVMAHWKALQKNPPADMLFKNHEPKITGYFCTSLSSNRLSHGITGYFFSEVPVAHIDITLRQLESKGRADIFYYSDRLDTPIELIFEFKKIKANTGANYSRKQYCLSGASRFVNAVYGRNSDVGFMVGMVEFAADVPAVGKALMTSIQGSDIRTQLRMILNPMSGRYVTTSSLFFPSCLFETRHERDHIPDSKDVLLGHFLLAHDK